MYNYQSNSAEKTFEFGRKLASLMQPGDVIALSGELGAGKTVFTKGLACGLGVNEKITSPTFTIIKEYDGKLPLYHFDVYRIESKDLDDLGYESYFYSKGISVVEWSEKITDKLPKDHLLVHIYYGQEENERKLEFKGYGDWERRIKQLSKNKQLF